MNPPHDQPHDALRVDEPRIRDDRGLRLAPAPSTDGPGGEPDPGGLGRVDLLLRDLARVLGCELALVCELVAGRRALVIAAEGLRASLTITVPRHAGRGSGRRHRGGATGAGGAEGAEGVEGATGADGAGGGFVGRALVLGRPAYEPLDPDRDAALIAAADDPLTHALSVPVLGGRRPGVLVAGFAAPLPDLEPAFWIADRYARLVPLVEQTDALGGLLAPRGGDGSGSCLTYSGALDALDREINRSARAGLTLTCCSIDLRGPRSVRGAHASAVGDETVAEIGDVVRENIRSCDTVGRAAGGLIVILPQTNQTGAARVAERLRSLIAGQDVGPSAGRLTASTGVAEWVAGTSCEQLLAGADGARLAARRLPGGVAVDPHRDLAMNDHDVGHS